MEKVVAIMFEIIDGRCFRSRQSVENGGSKFNYIMSGSHIKQRVIASEKYSHVEPEPFSITIISGGNCSGRIQLPH